MAAYRQCAFTLPRIMSLIPTPTWPRVFAMGATAAGSVISYNFGGVIVNDFVLTNTDHVLICAVLAILVAILLTLILWVLYAGWNATQNLFVAVFFLIFLFLVPLDFYIVLLLLQSVITSPFFAPNSGNQVIYFLLLAFSAVALLLAVSRRSLGLVMSGE